MEDVIPPYQEEKKKKEREKVLKVFNHDWAWGVIQGRLGVSGRESGRRAFKGVLRAYV